MTLEDFIIGYQIQVDEAARNAMLRSYLLELRNVPIIERDTALNEIARVSSLKPSIIRQQFKEMCRPPKKQGPLGEWTKNLLYKETSHGKELLPYVENLRVILSEHPLFADGIIYNEFTNQIDIRRPIELHAGLVIGDKRKQWGETDLTALRSWLNRTLNIDPKSTDIEAALKAEADRRSYHPVRDYLLSLPQWDGVYRLQFVFEQYFGTTLGGSPETDLKRYHNQLAAFYWFQSLIARVMPGHIEGRFKRPDAYVDGACGPGCFVKYAIVLEGPQSLMKSAAMQALLPTRAWYDDGDLDLDNEKKMGELLAGKWIWEIGEFDKVMRFHSGQVKSAIVRRKDRYRPAYARGTAVDFPRHCVFLGSTNEYEYFIDSTGNVRFWPIQCGMAAGLSATFQIDIKGLREIAPQLLAEALQHYGHGWEDSNTNERCPFHPGGSTEGHHLCFRWWPTPDEEKGVFKQEQSSRLQELPHERLVLDFLQECGKDGFTLIGWNDPDLMPTDIVIKNALHVSDAMQVTQLKTQVESCMKRAGWIKGVHRSKVRGGPVRGWKRPEV